MEQRGDSVTFYKIGLELFMAGGYFELLDWMVEEQGMAEQTPSERNRQP